jgi:hypothetical protein
VRECARAVAYSPYGAHLAVGTNQVSRLNVCFFNFYFPCLFSQTNLIFFLSLHLAVGRGKPCRSCQSSMLLRVFFFNHYLPIESNTTLLSLYLAVGTNQAGFNTNVATVNHSCLAFATKHSLLIDSFRFVHFLSRVSC